MPDIPEHTVPLQIVVSSRAPLVVLALALAGTAAVGYWQFREREKANALADESRRDLKAAQASVTALETKKAQLEAEKDELETAKTDFLSKIAQSKEADQPGLKGTYDKFHERMKEEIAHGYMHLEQTGDKLRVGLVDKVLFDSGEAQISKRGEGVLSRVAEALAGNPDKQIQVSGHTDRTPIASKLVAQYPSNWEFSVARATSVVRFLADKANIPPQRLVASGCGEYQPIASNKTAEGRARNRRIEILLTPTLAPKTISRSTLKAAADESTAGKSVNDQVDKKAGRKPKSAKARASSKHRRHD